VLHVRASGDFIPHPTRVEFLTHVGWIPLYPRRSSYNRVNGTHVSESKDLLDTILRKEWGWDGMIMSDWTGVYSSEQSVKAGLDLEMP